MTFEGKNAMLPIQQYSAAVSMIEGGIHMADNKEAQLQHSIIGVQRNEQADFVRTTHPDAQWFLKGGNLGLFIHWGISTVSGEGDLSWGMIDRTPWDEQSGGNYTIKPAEYWGLAEKFNPQNFHPEEFLQKAADAGFTYAVFTTRHHDGYALWPSEYGDFSTKQYMGGRDLVREYIEACRKCGLKVGLYYSPPDWYVHRHYLSYNFASFGRPDSGAPLLDMNFNVIDKLPEEPPELEDQYIAYVNGQVRELLHNYGKIDLLWFDGTTSDLSKTITIEEIRQAQPGIVVNDRLYHVGDYNSQFECRLPEEKPEGPWEHCHIWPEHCGWAYCNRTTGYRPAKWVYDSFRLVKEWGGNMLINVGPKADGSLPQEYYVEIEKLATLLNSQDE